MNDIFSNKKPNVKKLIEYGFILSGENYIYEKLFFDGDFKFIMKVSTSSINTEVIENSLNEPYTLHLVDGIQGTFVGRVRDEYNKIIAEISENCFERDIFKAEYTKKVIEYVREKYNDELEYLWEKFPDNAVLRRKDNKKWYAAILTVKRSKLGLEGEDVVEIIDLRAPEEEINTIVDGKKFFRGYHINKKHWLTIVLDGSVPIKEIYKRINASYELALKK